jgi:hypothetical protein
MDLETYYYNMRQINPSQAYVLLKQAFDELTRLGNDEKKKGEHMDSLFAEMETILPVPPPSQEDDTSIPSPPSWNTAKLRMYDQRANSADTLPPTMRLRRRRVLPTRRSTR